MQKKSWFLLTLAALALNAGSVYAGDDDDDNSGKEVTSSEESPKEQPAPTDCGCSG